MRRRCGLTGVAGLLLGMLCGTALASSAGHVWHGLRVEPPKKIAAYPFQNQDGRSQTVPLQNGKWQLVFFGYTHCPDICPMTIHKTTQLLAELGEHAGQIQTVFIGIDADRDSVDSMKQFLSHFELRIEGLTGTPENVQALANEFGVLTRRYQGKTALAYVLQHSSFLYLLDPQGRIRMLYPASADIPGMTADLAHLLAPEAARPVGTH